MFKIAFPKLDMSVVCIIAVCFAFKWADCVYCRCICTNNGTQIALW